MPGRRTGAGAGAMLTGASLRAAHLAMFSYALSEAGAGSDRASVAIATRHVGTC